MKNIKTIALLISMLILGLLAGCTLPGIIVKTVHPESAKIIYSIYSIYG